MDKSVNGDKSMNMDKTVNGDKNGGNLRNNYGNNGINIDIILLDKMIRKKFGKEKEVIPILEKYIGEIDITLGGVSPSRKRGLILRRNELDKKLGDIRDGINMGLYVLESREIIRRYNLLMKTPTKINFMGKNVVTEGKKEIIIEYLNIFQKYWRDVHCGESYISPEIFSQTQTEKKPKKDVCSNCGENTFDIIESEIICMKCGFLQDISNQFVSYNEIDRINISAVNAYDRTGSFMDIIYEFQGKEKYDIPKEVMEKLENDCKIYELVNPDILDEMMRLREGLSLISDSSNSGNLGDSGITDLEVIKGIEMDISLLRKRAYSRVTKYHTSIFLKETRIKNISKHLQLIHWKLTGQSRHDISHLEEKLLEDFKVLVELFFGKYKKNVERKSLLNKHFILYQLLLKNGYRCNKEEFFLLKTIDRINSQDTICQNLFKMLGWKYHNLY